MTRSREHAIGGRREFPFDPTLILVFVIGVQDDDFRIARTGLVLAVHSVHAIGDWLDWRGGPFCN